MSGKGNKEINTPKKSTFKGRFLFFLGEELPHQRWSSTGRVLCALWCSGTGPCVRCKCRRRGWPTRSPRPPAGRGSPSCGGRRSTSEQASGKLDRWTEKHFISLVSWFVMSQEEILRVILMSVTLAWLYVCSSGSSNVSWDIRLFEY